MFSPRGRGNFKKQNNDHEKGPMRANLQNKVVTKKEQGDN